jgi:hypothetical protein
MIKCSATNFPNKGRAGLSSLFTNLHTVWNDYGILPHFVIDTFDDICQNPLIK